jgi:DNA polymerase
LAHIRKKTYLGRGKERPTILFVLDPPESKDDPTIFPGGKAGELLTKIITNGLKMKEEDLYITPAIKCGPTNDDNDISRCSFILRREIELISPICVIALGTSPGQILAGEKTLPGILFHKKNLYVHNISKKIPLWITYGLKHMLKFPEIKRDVWETLKEALKSLKH